MKVIIGLVAAYLIFVTLGYALDFLRWMSPISKYIFGLVIPMIIVSTLKTRNEWNGAFSLIAMSIIIGCLFWWIEPNEPVEGLGNATEVKEENQISAQVEAHSSNKLTGLKSDGIGECRQLYQRLVDYRSVVERQGGVDVLKGMQGQGAASILENFESIRSDISDRKCDRFANTDQFIMDLLRPKEAEPQITQDEQLYIRAKQQLMECKYLSKSCAIDFVVSKINWVASREGGGGIKTTLGEPDSIQQTGYPSHQQYWYYRIGSRTYQLVWNTSGSWLLKTINTY